VETVPSEQSKSGSSDTSGAPVPIDVSYVGGAAWDADSEARMRWLRENDPVHWSKVDKLWIITRYADVAAVSRNQEVFTSTKGVRPTNPVRFGLVDEPEPRHGVLRKMLNRGFTPRMVKKLEEAFTVLVTETLDKVAAKGECDFVNDIAVPLPLLMIAEMLGIAIDKREDFHRWSDAMIAAEGNLGNPEIMQQSVAAFMEYSMHMLGLIEARKVEPRDDLISILVGADAQGTLVTFEGSGASAFSQGEQHDALAANEMMMLLAVLLVAGNETTRNALSGGTALLIENPQVRQRLIDDPGLIPAAVEEMLRLVSPVRSFSRTVTQDTVLRGKSLREGDLVLLCYPSANRDAEEFENPDSFDLERNPAQLAFGVGSHFCLGASLARMELRVAFTHLLRRFPDMRYAAGGPVILNNPLVRSCTEMRVRFTPEEQS
jgi:cytochrome P450 family 142 subfamily A polypeptide 1